MPRRAPLALSLAWAFLAPLGAASARPPALVRVEGSGLVTPDGAPFRMKGIGLGNWLVPEGYMFHFERAVAPRQIREVVAELLGPDDALDFWRRWREAYVTREDVRLARRLGFNTLRVPVAASLLSPEDAPGVWLDEGFATLDRLVGWARDEGLYVLLDLHAAHGGQTGDNIDDSTGAPWLLESARSQERTLEAWRRLARRYAREPAVLAYELLNEPIAHHADTRRLNPRLEPLYRRLVAAVREVDRDHVVVLGGAKWNTDFTVFGAPFAPGLAYAFHRYWCEPGDAAVAEYLAFRRTWNVPLLMTESGENDDAWVAAFRGTLERNDVGWAFWPWKKLDATTCVASVTPPRGWGEMVAYADGARGGTYEEKRKSRPRPARARAAFEELLANVQLARCRVNEGYVRALGLGGK